MEENKIQEEKELSIKEIFALVKQYAREIRKKWYLIIPFILIVGGYFMYQHHKHGIKYPASVTFLVNEDEGEDVGGNGINALLKSFTGKGTKDAGTGLEKVLQLFRSRSVIEKAIFYKVNINGKTDFLANHLVRIYGLPQLCGEYSHNTAWLNSIKTLKTFEFKNDKVENFDDTESRVAIVVYEAIAGNANEGIDPMILPALDDKSNIMRFGVTTDSEDLSIGLLEAIYSELSQFYINQTVEKQTKIYNLVKSKVDSLTGELAFADESLAKFQDSNRSLVWVTGELVKVKLQRKARITETLYAEAIKQLEMADFALKRKVPYVKVIDFPRKPIRPDKMSVLRSIAFTIVGGFLLGAIFIILRKVIIDALR